MDDLHLWAGTSLLWFTIELIMFMLNLVTFLLYLVRSRFMFVGIDHTSQFDQTYMAKLANLIIDNINFDIHEHHRSRAHTKRHLTRRT